MTGFLLSWHFFIISGAKYLKTFFFMSLTSWYIFDFMTKRIFDVMPRYLFSSFWEQNIMKTCFWCHWHYDIFLILYSKPLTSWQTFCHHAMFLINFLTSWQICWRHDQFLHNCKLLNIFDNFLDVLTCFWGHNKLLDVMTCFWLICDIMTNFL